jgi:hypothetical protein
MSSARVRLTPELQERICSYVRSGGYLHVAAEAAGVPRAVFDRWVRRGSGRKRLRRYRAFVVAIRQAAAQGRLMKEMEVLREKPLDWLRYGPGRETTDTPGWTSAGKPAFGPAGDGGNLLENPVVLAWLHELVERLTPTPEARLAAAEIAAAGGPPHAGRGWGTGTPSRAEGDSDPAAVKVR